MKQHGAAIAKNLRSIREGRNLSLDQLSDLTGVSKSMLRQIETGRSSPTIATIWKIANGLRLSFTSLLRDRSPAVAIRDFKAEKPLTAESERYRVWPMISFDPDRAFEFYHMEIDPETTFHGEPHKGNSEEYVFVTAGKLEITIDENRYNINAGQCIQFQADSPHTYHNTGDETVSAIMMICYLF